MSHDKKKILFLLTEDYYFTAHRLHFAADLVKHGYEVALGCRVSNQKERIEKEGIQVFHIPFERENLSPWNVLRACWHIRRLIRFYRPHMIHTVALMGIFSTWMATIGIRRLPILNAIAGFGTLYSGELKSLKLKFVRFVADILLRLVFRAKSAYTVLQNSDDLKVLVDGKLAKKEQVFLIRGSGVNPQSWLPQDEILGEKLVVLFVSRLLKDKGVGDLVQASQLVKKKGISHILRVVGNVDPCNPESFSREEIQKWHDEGWMEWLGHRKDVLQQMSLANIIALPSYYREGLPGVLLEAGLAQRAAITCDSIGCREVVRDGDNGLLVPPRNPMALAAAIEKLLTDEELRLRLAKRNRERICEEFSSEIIHQQFFDLYEKILKENP